MTGLYFGRHWDAPAFDDAVPVAAPVDRVCLLCSEPIGAEDSGTFFGATFGADDARDGEAGVPPSPEVLAEMVARAQPVHLECWLRQGLGDVPHLEGRCSCAGGSEHDDRPYREGARATLDWLLAHGRGRFAA